MLFALTVLGLVSSFSSCLSQDDVCPPGLAGCFCEERKSGNSADLQVGLRIQCLPVEDFVLDFGSLPSTTIQLDLSKNELEAIDAKYFTNLRHLDKLDLRGNRISRIAGSSFAHLASLTVLDLSENMLTDIHANTFTGLVHLEKLKLNDNLIRTIALDAFSPLTSILKIDLSENRLTCDCEISWLLEWSSIALNKIRCHDPPNLKDVLLKKLSTSQLICDEPAKIGHLDKISHMDDYSGHIFGKKKTFQFGQNPFGHSEKFAELSLNPDSSQLVVEGDPLRLSCSLEHGSQEAVLSWLLNGEGVSEPGILVSSLNPVLEEGGGTTSNIYISKIRMRQAGIWTCSALLQSGHREERSVNVQIMSKETVLCPAAKTNSSKGEYSWGVTLGGQMAEQECSHPGPGKVRYQCDESGAWGGLNETTCRHLSDVTDKLARFSSMNHSKFDPVTLDQAAEKLLEFTEEQEIFTDSQDIIYLTQSVENYVSYLKGRPRLASILVRIIDNVLHMSGDLIYGAQRVSQAAERLNAALKNIVRVVPAFQYSGDKLVVSGLSVSAGLSCSWSNHAPAQHSRAFECAENNQTSLHHLYNQIGSLQLPDSLFRKAGSKNREDTGLSRELVLTGFNNNKLFKQVGGYTVMSPVVGVNLLNSESFNLSDPVKISLEFTKSSSGFSEAGAANVRPAWWDQRPVTGPPVWSPDPCHLVRLTADRAEFTCSRLGHYALIQSSDGGVVFFRAGVHPSVYLGCLVGVVGLALSVFTYTILFHHISVGSKIKHCLINNWSSTILFLVMYSVFDDLDTLFYCSIAGLFVHYTVLSTVFWLTLTSLMTYRRVEGRGDRRVHSDSIYGQITHQTERDLVFSTPVARYYVIGWGLPLIISGVTAGASHHHLQYSGMCFLSPEVSAASLLAPTLTALVLHVYYTTRILIHRLEGAHASIHPHKDHRLHGGVLCVQTVLILAILSCAALNVMSAYNSSLGAFRTTFSLVLAAAAASVGVLIPSFYCLARRDVNAALTNTKSGYTGEDSSNLLSPQQLRSTSTKRQNNFLPTNFFGGTDVQETPNLSKMADSSNMAALVHKQQNQFINMSGEYLVDHAESESFINLHEIQGGGGSVIGYCGGLQEVEPSELCRQSSELFKHLPELSKPMSEFSYNQNKIKVKNINLLVDKDKVVGKATWNQGNPEAVSFSDHNFQGGITPENSLAGDYSGIGGNNSLAGSISELSPCLPPPNFPLPGPRSPSFGPWKEAQSWTPESLGPPPSRAQQLLGPIPPSSLLRQKKQKLRNRHEPRLTQSGLSDFDATMERPDRADTAFSEVSSSVYSSRSGRKARDKPRRKLRKRSEVLEAGKVRENSARVRDTSAARGRDSSAMGRDDSARVRDNSARGRDDSARVRDNSARGRDDSAKGPPQQLNVGRNKLVRPPPSPVSDTAPPSWVSEDDPYNKQNGGQNGVFTDTLSSPSNLTSLTSEVTEDGNGIMGEESDQVNRETCV